MPDTKFTGIGYVTAVSSVFFYVGFCGIITAIPKPEK